MERFRLLVVLILIAGALGCIRNKNSAKVATEIILPDSSKQHEVGLTYKYVKNIGRELNLKDLEFGVDSLEWRIYEDFSLGYPDRVIILKNEAKIWTCTLISFYPRIPKEEERVFNTKDWKDEYSNTVVDSYQCFNIIPHCDWSMLIDSLKKYDIETIPTQRDIANFEDKVNDGWDYYFELATKNRYKFYSYHCPDVYNDEYNKKATSILKIISRQVSPLVMCKW